MSEENSESVSTTSDIERETQRTNQFLALQRKIDTLVKNVHDLELALSGRMDTMTNRIQEMDERQRTIMVGWNAFLKSAEAQLKFLFKGTIPAPILKKLIQTAFKGIEDMERKGK